MSGKSPLVSVVIPSRDAPASLTVTLEGLAQQTMAAGLYEVIVVGGVDEETIRQRVPAGLPYALRVMIKPGPGASRRRNAGAAEARAALLVFLDDDMGPEPGLLEAHYRAHVGGNGRRVVIGYLPPSEDFPFDNVSVGKPRVDWLKMQLRDWWEEGFEAMAQPGHRFAYTDVLSGNLSLPAALFRQVGGFDVDYYPCRDDFELGVRLLQVGAELAMCPAARSCHHDKTDLPRLLQRKSDEGRMDVQLARQYPHLRPALLIARQFSELAPASRALRRVARSWPAAAEFLAKLLIPPLGWCERLSLRYTWPRLMGGLLVHAYWRGVLQATRDWEEVRALTNAPAPTQATLDLSRGMQHVAEMLERCPVQGALLAWHGIPLGRIDAQAGAEAVRGRHVEAWIRERGAVVVARAQALDEILGIDETTGGELEDKRALQEYPDLCAGCPCEPEIIAGKAAPVRLERPAWILEVDLKHGNDALSPLLTTYAQQVLVRQGEQRLGWLQLKQSERRRSVGEVMYAILAQLDNASLIAP